MKTILAALFSGLIQGFLSIFGLSTDRKLGRVEAAEKAQAEVLQKTGVANEVQNSVDRLSDAAVDSRLRSRWSRD